MEGWTERCEDWDDWDKSGPAFKAYGNTYYVGTCGIAAILITGDDGHILIDSGTRNGATIVLANIVALGFDPKDVKLLLTSHEHHDHIGGMAGLQAATGAQLVTSVAAAKAIETGKAQPSDPQFGMHDPFEPANVARRISGGEIVSLGKLALMPIETPGHTEGALSWQWWSCEKTDCRMIVYADSMSPVSGDSYRFSEHPDYVAAYREGIERIAAQPCDILMTPHPTASWMRERIIADGHLFQEGQCARYATRVGENLDKRLAREAEEK